MKVQLIIIGNNAEIEDVTFHALKYEYQNWHNLDSDDNIVFHAVHLK